MFKRLFSAAVIFGASALAPPVSAQVARCLPRADLIRTLETNYKEQMIGGGLQNATQLLEVWTSPESGSFTIFLTRADGISCLISSGQNWTHIEQVMEEGVAG